MAFSSLPFAAFFAAVFIVYWIVPWQRARIWWLVGASVFFYASWSKELALLVTATSVMDYLLARGMERFPSPRSRKALLGLSLAVNLGLLCYFKYVNFFLDALRAGLAASGLTMQTPALNIIVPFGISFYTFEAISYTIDVYRGRLKAEKSLANFMLFILFFPHLVAGPIVRAWDFLPQAGRAKRWSWIRVNLGMQLFILGLFKKMAIADRLAVYYSDPVFDNPGAHNSMTVWLGLIAFAVRIWADFSGYSDMALGAAHMLGYKLNKNFDLPYLSTNIAEFWRRWHISLSTWLRDYLFIPMGGSRGTTLQTCRNLMITMTLGGLWHGANWSYVMWGVLHGSFLVSHRLFRAWCETRPTAQTVMASAPARLGSLALTCFCVLLAWTFFQPSLDVTTTLLRRLFVPSGGNHFIHIAREGLYVTVALVAVGHLIARHGKWRRYWNAMPAPVAGMASAWLFFMALLVAPPASKPFIYFQF
jgi:alginate O-acetyltransferase complex protein AlgI